MMKRVIDEGNAGVNIAISDKNDKDVELAGEDVDDDHDDHDDAIEI